MDEINKLKQQANLHSSMDRFEDLSAIYIVRKTSIYIPVWIDLKPKGTKLYKNKILFTFQYG